MASFYQAGDGCTRFQFFMGGRRKSIRLGRLTKKQAEAFRLRIERLVAAKLIGHPPDDETSRWLSDLPDETFTKLSATGLVAPRSSSKLAAFVDQYIAKRTDLSDRSRDIMRRARNSLVEFFGADKPLRDITRGDAQDWRRFLRECGGMKGEPLSQNTANDRCKKAKQFFRAAVEHKLIPDNPFAILKGTTVRANQSRFVYIDHETILRVMDAATDAEFRLLIALCRFGGLRSPSETLLLKWSDVNLAERRMVVTSPKTAHHEGKETRIVPITAELYPYLAEAFDAAPEGTQFVIERYRDQDKNLRTRMLKTIRRAGVAPWTKPFQNLRSSCQTD